MKPVFEKEWDKLLKKEEKFLQGIRKEKQFVWKQKIEEKIPQKLEDSLKAAFGKAFFMMFEKGNGWIEKTISNDLVLEYDVNEFRMQKAPTKQSWKKLKQKGGQKGNFNTMLTTLEGVGLGTLGIGLPDIPIFIGMLLKGLYETAACYGFDYQKEEEKIFLLWLICGAMGKDDLQIEANEKLDKWIMEKSTPIYDKKKEIEKAADALAFGMLMAKFIQGIPIVGIVGGAINPLIYHKIQKYANLKYQKRYLRKKGKYRTEK